MDSNRTLLEQNDPEIYDALIGEEARQAAGIELIPSENYTYPEVIAALGSVFTNKYSEGYPGRRYYGGQEYTDVIEEIARTRAKQIFRAEHVNVQPLSGAPMNAAVYQAIGSRDVVKTQMRLTRKRDELVVDIYAASLSTSSDS